MADYELTAFDTWEEADDRLYTAFADIYVETETITGCTQNDWFSPTTGQVNPNVPFKEFSYAGGTLTYNGDRPIAVAVVADAALSTTGTTVDMEITNGVNGVPCTVGAMPASTVFLGGAQKLTFATICTFVIQPGDNLDFFFRQTSEASTDITIEKLRFVVLKLG